MGQRADTGGAAPHCGMESHGHPVLTSHSTHINAPHSPARKAAHCGAGPGTPCTQEQRIHAAPTWPTRCVEETGRGSSPTAVSSLLHQPLTAFQGHFMGAEVLEQTLDLPWGPAQPRVRTSASASPHEAPSQGLLSITAPWKEGGGRHWDQPGSRAELGSEPKWPDSQPHPLTSSQGSLSSPRRSQVPPQRPSPASASTSLELMV